MTPIEALEELGGRSTAQEICDKMRVDYYNKHGIIPHAGDYQNCISKAIEVGELNIEDDWDISINRGEGK